MSEWQPTLCPYCGVGCGLLVRVEDGAVSKVKGDPDHPSSLGDVCAKAVHLPPALRTDDRLLYPQIRTRRDGPFQRVPWELALRFVADRFRELIAAHGPDAVAFYASGQLLTEEYYVGGKLAKGFLGTNNFDSNSRLCMASAAAGYTRSLGSDGPPAAYADIELADCFLLIGTNTADCHPITFKRIRKRKLSAPEDVTVIVADPRWTETADIADLHLPLRPGSDIALLNAMLHVLWRDGRLDQAFIAAHTAGWAQLQAVIERYPPERAAAITGLSREIIVTAASRFGRARAALTLWSMGINQSHVGTDKNAAIINLHLATGQIGRPGAGPFSLTGQPNAMGGRETGGLAHLLPGYRRVSDAAARAVVEEYWGVAAGRIAPRPGRSALEIFEGLAHGDVRAVWILCTNPAASMPDLDLVEKALRQAELVVVQDAYHPTETTRFADVLLPAAQWPEKDGVMTNSERRLTYLRKLVDPPGEALPDAVILTRFAHEMGWKQAFPYASAAEIFDEFAALTAGTVCDCSGVSHARLQAEGPLQWPCPAVDHPGTERLYADARFPTADGRARFVVVEHDDLVEPPDAAFPLTLTTGRVRDHWHTMTRTGKSPALMSRTREPILEVNARDARRAGIRDGDFVDIMSRRGKAVAQCRVSETIREGTCFLPFHWGRGFGFYKSANNLTLGARDPISMQPELKACAVRLRPLAEIRFVPDASLPADPGDPRSGWVDRGRVVLVGAGPGDPELITLRGLRWLRRAEVVVYDQLVAPSLLDEAPASALRIFAGKSAGRHCLPQPAINALLIHHAEAGRLVVRLKGGDPFVFGRGGEEVLACEAAGITVEVVPGVSSAVAVPAAAGIPLTLRGLSSSFAVVTGHEDPAKPQGRVDWPRLATAVDTLVILMGVGGLPQIATRLIEAGRDPRTPAAVIHRGTTAAQQVVTGTLGDIARRAAGVGAPAVIVIGEVARCAQAVPADEELASPAPA